MDAMKNRVDYFELRKRLKFVNRPLFEFCGAYVAYLDSRYGLNQNDPKINKLCAKQLLYNEIMKAFELELSPFVQAEIDAFDFCGILQCVLKAFLFDYQNINSFDTLMKKYDNFKIEDLFDFIGGCFINEYSQSKHDDWPNSDMEKMVTFIKELVDIDEQGRQKILNLYEYPLETKMRIRHVIVSMYEVFKKFESATVEQSKKQSKRYANLMEIDYGYFCQILKLDELSEVIRNNEKVELYISYMFSVGYYCKEYNDGCVFLLNGFLCDEYHAMKVEQHSVENFLSILGDKDCMNVLMCYAKRPYYLLELSREMGIAPAKLRMINKRFLDADMIDFEHKNNRRYYLLKKEEIGNYFDMCKRLFK